ncbi:DNA cytosine methyltransferase [Arthrobacter glacialis]|uniref:Cytosine-specific methyltransferase n=1 Tax=Arthrobacter glacialis TaxID=1664 RepID=A0A2S3ZVG1_ARTGL|nr:DNA (cytosine-5-)-methyltransferase [Arthrobacter glacialis]POH73074.1 DNA (cytosine-5-)-methyltransferase [Arthrobacter glacialis]
MDTTHDVDSEPFDATESISADQPTFKFIDLFAGLGGFHTALARMGGKAVFAAEWVKELSELYETNYGLKPKGDISKIDPITIPDHDVLAAGFPCQPFSKAGEQLGFEHTEQGQLFFKVVAILKEKKPKWFILENVPNIIKHKDGKTLEKILDILENDLEYTVKIQKLSPHQFGIPQIRDRVYFVGSLAGLDNFAWPEPTNEPTDIRNVLDENPTQTRSLSPNVLNCLETWQEFLKACPKETDLPSFPLWSMEFGASYPFEDETPHALIEELGGEGLSEYLGSFGHPLAGMDSAIVRNHLPSHALRPQYQFPKWKKDFIRQNRDFYAQNKEWIDPWLPKIQKFPSSMQKLEWNVKGHEKNIWDFVIQFRASGVRLKRTRTAPSLIAMTDTQVPIIGWEKRYMTPLECARLQSLESIQLPSTPTVAYRALGNAVNSKVVEKIASRLIHLN